MKYNYKNMKTHFKTILMTIICFAPFFKMQAQTYAMYYIDANDCKKVHFFDSLNFTASVYQWQFGDGSVSYNANPTHTYASNGVYSVAFFAYDSINSISILDSFQVTINCSANPCANFNASYNYVKDSINCGKVNFNGFPTTANNYYWQFGDGTSSTSTNPSHTYAANGNYWVYLDVNDSTCSDSLFFQVSINCYSSPCANFNASYSYVKDSINCGKVNFNGFPTTANNYYWQFGDGTSSTSANPSHTYSSNGTYWLYLDVSDSFCSDSVYFNININCYTDSCSSFNANLTFVVDSTTAGKCYLYNNSTGNVNSHFWDFGDGTTSTSATPTHTYTSSGTYTIRYYAEDTLNYCFDSAFITFTIDSNGNIWRGNVNVQLVVVDQTRNAVSIENITNISSSVVYPNPTNGLFTIKSKGMHNAYQIFNMKGQLIETKKQVDSEVLEIDCADWASGIYLIHINKNESIKIIKE